jgi:acetolactate decarboxylase
VPKLICEIPESLMQALSARQAATGGTLSHLVMSLLAEQLGTEYATLFQVSTAGALVEGVFDGVVTIRSLREHGDMGLGTFDALDGEMLAVDGRFYQIRADGTVTEPAEDATVPFAVVARFRPEQTVTSGPIADFDVLAAQLDAMRQTNNMFYAARVEGRFAHVRTRAACKAARGESLVQATARQAEFDFQDFAGTMVGFWSPVYAQGLNIAGWHMHFLANDRSGGGHLLACRGADLTISAQELPEVRIAMPETAAFLRANLGRDPARDLDIAEKSRR